MFGGVYEVAAKGGGVIGLMTGIGAMDAGVDGGGGGGATIATGFGVATGTFVAGSFMLYKILLNRGVQGVYPAEKIFSENTPLSAEPEPYPIGPFRRMGAPNF